MFQELLLAFIVSIDTCLVSASLSGSGIRIPLISALVINVISAAVLGISIRSAAFLSGCVPADICHTAGTAVMVFIGTLTVMKSVIRNLTGKEFSLKMGRNIVLRLYLDDTAADLDNSNSISPAEASAAALAGSLDSAAAGLSCGLSGIIASAAALSAFFLGCIAFALGCLAGKKISSLDHDMSWLGGVMLIMFSFFV